MGGPGRGLLLSSEMQYSELHILLEVPMEILALLGVVAAWYILSRWVLPRLGVQT